jgi:uncharacterized protein YecT (DUF1311 family)
VVADPCLEQPERSSTPSMISCFDREVLLWDRMLTDRFGNLITQLDESAREQVREVHEAWSGYRDKRCALGEALFPEAALASLWGADCMLQETGRRAIEVAILIESALGVAGKGFSGRTQQMLASRTRSRCIRHSSPNGLGLGLSIKRQRLTEQFLLAFERRVEAWRVDAHRLRQVCE